MQSRGPWRLVLVISIVFVLLLGLILLNRATPQTEVVAPDAPQAEQRGEGAVALEEGVTRETPITQREEQKAAPIQAAQAPALAIVRGRCVAKESGVPLAGCTVEFSGRASNSGAMARHGPVDWTDPEPVVTGTDGVFEFAFAPPPPFQHSLGVICEGRTPRTARWGAFTIGQVEDLGDIALQRGHLVEGFVVDTEGAPVPGVSVAIGNLPLPIASGMAANDTRHGRSGEDGRFVVSVAIPAGTWSLDASPRGMRLVSPDSVTVVEGSGAAPITVVLRRMPSISGIVVDELGAPVERISVRAELNRSGRMASGRTREDGTFIIHAVDEELSAVRLRISDPGPCEPPDEATPPYEWGTTDVRIELQRALSFELTVVERGSSTPVEEFSLLCYSTRSSSSRQRSPRLGGKHPDGRVTVEKIWRGANHLIVLPNDPQLAASERIEFEADGAPLPAILVEVERLVPRPVRVITSTGDPAVGSRVELIRAGSGELKIDSHVPQRGAGGMTWSSRPDHRPHELTSDAITDSRGEATVLVSRETVDLGIRVTGEEHQPLFLRTVEFPTDGTPLLLTVPIGGRLVGTLHVEGYPTAQLRIAIRSTDARRGGFGQSPNAEVDAAGEFEVKSLAAGQYELYLGLMSRYKTEHGSSGSQVDLGQALTTVIIEEGLSTEIEIDASHLNTGTINGSILLDGAPPGECRVYLAYSGSERSHAWFGQFVPDADGRFEASGLPPGSYQVGIVVGHFKTGTGDHILSGETFTLAPGQTVDRGCDLERLILRVRLLGEFGKTPVANTDVQVSGDDLHSTQRTDADGWLTLNPAPRGPVMLSVQQLVGGPVEVPRGQREAEFEVVLKAR